MRISTLFKTASHNGTNPENLCGQWSGEPVQFCAELGTTGLYVAIASASVIVLLIVISSVYACRRRQASANDAEQGTVNYGAISTETNQSPRQ